MEITLFQGLLLMLVGFICALDEQWEAFYWFRPMVVAFLAGIVLGDVSLGVSCGAVAELSYLGLLTVGGTVPPNALMAGMMTTVIAYTTGQSMITKYVFQAYVEEDVDEGI
ncbi:MAG: PTS sugar transporter subunit IIC [Erysipelotrichaceae bacterium]|nr:PTS sugar transporter subunit IIC [Erysipelotrichaceae bacterium]